MKNSIIIALLLGIGVLFFSSCNKEANNQDAAKESTTTTEQSDMMHEHTTMYTCPIHPEVKSDKPGKCPKCGMNQEKATAKADDYQDR